MGQIINTLGLLFDIAGASILFIYGLPQPDFDESVGIALEDATLLSDGLTVAQHAELSRAKKKQYKTRASIGLGLITFGFVLQLIATWL